MRLNVNRNSEKYKEGAPRRWAGRALTAAMACCVVVGLARGVFGTARAGFTPLWFFPAAAMWRRVGLSAVQSPSPTPGTAPLAGVPGKFTTEQFTDASGARMTYYLYLPPDFSPDGSYPVVLILHGTGERMDTSRTAAQNRDHILSQSYVDAFVDATAQAKYPSIVVVPQIAGDSARWVDTPGGEGNYILTPSPTVSLKSAVDIVATVERAYSAADANRIYLMGISMGAYGVWDAVERWPGLFAAAAPISGSGDPTHVNAITHLPIWDFHGTADTNVPVAGSRLMYDTLARADASECYTEFPGKAHDLWTTVGIYSQPEFLAWLFGQTNAPTSGQSVPSCRGVVITGVAAK